MPHTYPPSWAVRTEADRRAIAAGYYWDDAQAQRVIRFAETHVAPKYIDGDFQLFEWQRRLLMSLYGWRRPDGGRRFSQALLHVAKKNGKTLLVSVIAQYELFAAGVKSPLVVSASTTKKNATQVFEQMRESIGKNESLKRLVKFRESDKVIRLASPRDGEFWSMSSDASNAEGWNISCGIVDECHAHENARLFNAMEHGTTGRANGLLVTISTAGEDLTHFYYSLVQRARNVLAGLDTDPTFYAEVYECNPEVDDLDDPATWKKANPSLGLYEAFSVERFRLGWAAAKPDTARRLNFMRYRLNIFCRPEEGGWIDLAKWDLCRADVPDADLLAALCYLAFDGSATTDPTSLTAVWVLPHKRFHARSWAWVAEEGVRRRESTNLPRYQQFAADGVMTVSKGNMIDKDLVRAKIDAIRADGHQVQEIVLDITGAHVFGSDLEAGGYVVYRQPQSFAEFTEPLRECEAAVLDRRMSHDGGSWLRWCVNSLRLKTNDKNEARPVRAHSADHIDGAVSMLMAFSRAFRSLATAAERKSVYDERGILFF